MTDQGGKPLSELLSEKTTTSVDVAIANEAIRNAGSTEEQKPAAPKMTNGQKKRMRQQQEQFAQMFKSYQEKQQKQRKIFKRAALSLRNALCKEDYNNLKNICTVRVSEQKNEAGEVTRKASSYVDYRALAIEGRLTIAVQREQRIKSGHRKSTTGRSSDRKAQKNLMKFINRRNEETLQKEPVKV